MLLKLGIVGRALGLQGFFFVSGRDEPIAPSIVAIKIGRTLDTARDAKVVTCGWQTNRPTIKCSLAGDRTAAELLTGMTIWAEETHVHVDDSKEFLLNDLIGRKVIDSDGMAVGVVEDVIKMPASINIVVVNLTQSADVDIPMISDYVDMSFQRGDKELKLAVPISTFEEIWNPRVKK
jgi:ribosomal 30S subunit maturation factor RimM